MRNWRMTGFTIVAVMALSICISALLIAVTGCASAPKTVSTDHTSNGVGGGDIGPASGHGVPIRIKEFTVDSDTQNITEGEPITFEIEMEMAEVSDDGEQRGRHGHIVMFDYDLPDGVNLADVFKTPPLAVLITEKTTKIEVQTRGDFPDEAWGSTATFNAISGHNREKYLRTFASAE